MNSKATVAITAVALIILGLALTGLKHFGLGFPLLPGERTEVWTVEAKASFNATERPIVASLALPAKSDFHVIDESFGSAGYGFTLDENTAGRRAIWSTRSATGKQALYYKLQGYSAADRRDVLDLPAPAEAPLPPQWGEAESSAAKDLSQRAHASSGNSKTFLAQLLQLINDPDSQNSAMLLSQFDKHEAILNILATNQINTHVIKVIPLRDQTRNIKAEEFIAAWIDDSWLVFDPESNSLGIGEEYLIWEPQGRSLLDLEGGFRSHVYFSIVKNDLLSTNVAIKEGYKNMNELVDFSIYSLPVEAQSTFKFILMVPLGVLIVVLLRVLIGVKTSGTFMPVLIAIAFLQTSLATGLSVFLLIVLLGVGIRGYLASLNLLLVSRIAALVTIVVILMSLIAIFSHKLGWTQALSVTFFTMIILAWTIERMSIIWEEDGGQEVLMQGGGSLFVAILCFLIMKADITKHLFFNFPELLLSVLGLTLLLGHYTGYKLSELWRFRFLKKEL